MTRRRKHHPITIMVLGTGVLLAADAAAWLFWMAWHIMPVLLAIVACKHWQLQYRAAAWLRRIGGQP